MRNPTYTYSFWVKVASYPSNESAGAMLEFGSVPAQPKYGINVSLNNNYLTSQGRVYTSGSTNFTWISTKNTALPSLARWYHILVSRNDKMNVWVDGELVSTSSVDGLTQYYTTPLDGYIDSVFRTSESGRGDC